VKTSTEKLHSSAFHYGMKIKMTYFTAALSFEPSVDHSHKFCQLKAVSATWDKIGFQDVTNMIYKGICITRENFKDT